MSAQLSLPIAPTARKQSAKPNPKANAKVKPWGGSRPGAGRKPTGKRRDPVHRPRPRVLGREPQHVVLRTVKSLPRLRKRRYYEAVRHSLRRMLGDLGFRVCHVSIQHNHLHLLVEAADKNNLRRGMQGLAISVAKRINKLLKRKGKVFEFRYHATAIKSPRQARHALAYVLNNWRRHNEDERTLASRFAMIDPYSSARSFDGWKEGGRIALARGFEQFEALEVSEPRTWFLRVGWQKTGLAISAHATPGLLTSRWVRAVVVNAACGAVLSRARSRDVGAAMGDGAAGAQTGVATNRNRDRRGSLVREVSGIGHRASGIGQPAAGSGHPGSVTVLPDDSWLLVFPWSAMLGVVLVFGANHA